MLTSTTRMILPFEGAIYRTLFDNMIEGFAYCRMIYDNDGHPEDLIYINVNCAFDRIIGIKNVTGKRFTEVFSGVRQAYPELFLIYGRVAWTGIRRRSSS